MGLGILEKTDIELFHRLAPEEPGLFIRGQGLVIVKPVKDVFLRIEFSQAADRENISRTTEK